MMRAVEEEETIEHLRTLLISRAATLDRESQEEVDKYNELNQNYMDYAFPDSKEKREQKEQQFMQTFDSIFKSKSPQEIKVSAGDDLEGSNINDVLKSYKEGSKV